MRSSRSSALKELPSSDAAIGRQSALGRSVAVSVSFRTCTAASDGFAASCAADTAANPAHRTMLIAMRILLSPTADRGSHSTASNLLSERFHNSCALATSVRGGIYFHPSDEDLSLGTRQENATQQ